MAADTASLVELAARKPTSTVATGTKTKGGFTRGAAAGAETVAFEQLPAPGYCAASASPREREDRE